MQEVECNVPYKEGSMKLANVRMGPKLIGGFCGVALISLVVGIIGLRCLTLLDKAQDEVQNNATLPIADLQAISMQFEKASIALRNMILSNSAENSRDNEIINTAKTTIGEKIQHLQSVVTAPEFADKLEHFAEVRKAFGRDLGQIMLLLQAGNRADAQRIMAGDARISITAEEDAINDLVATATQVAQRKIDKSQALADTAKFWMTVIMILGFIIAAMMGIMLTLSITKPLKQSVDMMNELSKGHLDSRIDDSRKDEIGDLSKAMNSFADDLQHTVVDTMK
jgi:methyl-accepting chemotaxis protein